MGIIAILHKKGSSIKPGTVLIQGVSLGHNRYPSQKRKQHQTRYGSNRTHPHYLKGSIFCGECGGRLIYSRNKGKMGVEYEYFFCIGRKNHLVPCSRKFIKLPAIEDGIAGFYRKLALTPERAGQVKDKVSRELATEQAETEIALRASREQLKKVENERAKLMEAHYAGAVPLDILKKEMDRLTRELNAANKPSTAPKRPTPSYREI